jgi:hypothetical protein
MVWVRTPEPVKDIPVSDYCFKINHVDGSLMLLIPYANVSNDIHVQNLRRIVILTPHFFLIQQHYPDRVMTRFGLF